MPRGLRRSEPTPSSFDWRSGLPQGTAHGGPIHPSPQGEVGLQGGESTSSTPGHGPSTAISGNYRDNASQPKSGAASVNAKQPFNLTK